MANISAKEVNQLRKETGAGMMDCKKALVEANGDFEEAILILRKKGQKVSAKRANNDTLEGAVFVKTSADAKVGYSIALNCETDFVAKNEEFSKLGNGIIDAVEANGLTSIEEAKAATIGDLTVEAILTDMIGKIGEKIEITAVEKVEADAIGTYTHSNGKLGVLVALTGASGDAVLEIGKDVAMQVAAMSPISVGPNDVPQEIKDKELALGREQAIAEGKPEQIVDKIAQGKLNKFYKDNTLLAQAFVKDGGQSVEQVLKSVDSNLTVTSFKRVSIG
ncbi:MAG: elongation factor Ts [Cytophagales bacterium]|nr:elongation factor Ts [Cytophagales bacterium]